MTERTEAINYWNQRWPDSLRVENQYNPAYIAQREAFIEGFVLATKLLTESKGQP